MSLIQPPSRWTNTPLYGAALTCTLAGSDKPFDREQMREAIEHANKICDFHAEVMADLDKQEATKDVPKTQPDQPASE